MWNWLSRRGKTASVSSDRAEWSRLEQKIEQLERTLLLLAKETRKQNIVVRQLHINQPVVEQVTFRLDALDIEELSGSLNLGNNFDVQFDPQTLFRSGNGAGKAGDKNGGSDKTADKAGSVGRAPDKTGSVSKAADKASSVSKAADKAGSVGKAPDKAGSVSKAADKASSASGPAASAGKPVPSGEPDASPGRGTAPLERTPSGYSYRTSPASASVRTSAPNRNSPPPRKL
ncbi:hypothetical protein ACFFNY_26135 [Paenibacillus hodogayensis]|uniref:Uncharacterized protein n=1 Tax=Paenibacillus hodogayensis TaxID=279208 RepID=A0ABV5W3B6_9BACL